MKSTSNPIKIKKGKPRPDHRSNREFLPANIGEILKGIEPDHFFHLPTDDDQHTVRKSRALRSRISRLQNDHPEMRVSVRHEPDENGQIGVAVYRLDDVHAD